MTYTVEQAQARCRYWQQVLRLQDWNVTVRLGRFHEMKSATAVAQVWTSCTLRDAVITLLDPDDFRPDHDAAMRDMDDSLVHELLHLHMKDLGVMKADGDDPPTPPEIAEERAIAALAAAFVRLNRSARS
ncbi:MAG: hypothetical protein AB7Q29_19585 [Vicinamibacterales bacterium]